jgi:chromosome segregation ATPase
MNNEGNGDGNHDVNVNGYHDSSRISSANSVEPTELGEVKIALGRLYREFEGFKLSQKTERERDRAELQAWAQTNLIQNQLLSKAMVTIEMLTGELKSQNLSWNELEKSNFDLKQELTPLLRQLKNMPKSSAMLESLEFKGLRSEVLQLKQNGNDLATQTNNLTKIIHELKNSLTQITTKEKEVYRGEPQGNGCFMALGTGLGFLVLFFVINQLIPVKISDDIQNNLQSIWQRTGYSNVKLQRIEKHLGTESNRQK